jgi:hypothetical protein
VRFFHQFYSIRRATIHQGISRICYEIKSFTSYTCLGS